MMHGHSQRAPAAQRDSPHRGDGRAEFHHRPRAIDDDITGALPVFRRPGINGNELSVSLHAKLPSTLARIECETIKSALTQHKGKATGAAKALGISRKGLYLKRQRFGLY